MAKGQDAKKAVKKKSDKTLKEKRKEKKEKKAGKDKQGFQLKVILFQPAMANSQNLIKSKARFCTCKGIKYSKGHYTINETEIFSAGEALSHLTDDKGNSKVMF